MFSRRWCSQQTTLAPAATPSLLCSVPTPTPPQPSSATPRNEGPSFSLLEEGGTGFHVTNRIPFLLKQCFQFISYVQNVGGDNKTFLLKHFPFHWNLLFSYSLVVFSKKKIPNFTGKQRNSKKSLAELWEKSKFSMSFKLSTYSTWSAAMKNTHSQNEKALLSSNLLT